MYDLSLMDCTDLTVEAVSDARITLDVRVKASGITPDGDFSHVFRTEKITLFGLPEHIKAALVEALRKDGPTKAAEVAA